MTIPGKHPVQQLLVAERTDMPGFNVRRDDGEKGKVIGTDVFPYLGCESGKRWMVGLAKLPDDL